MLAERERVRRRAMRSQVLYPVFGLTHGRNMTAWYLKRRREVREPRAVKRGEQTSEVDLREDVVHLTHANVVHLTKARTALQDRDRVGG